MTEAADITANLRAIGRLHTRVDSLGVTRRGALNGSIPHTVEFAHRAATGAIDELVRLTGQALASGAPTAVHTEPIFQARGAVDQALAKLDAVLFDVVATAEA